MKDPVSTIHESIASMVRATCSRPDPPSDDRPDPKQGRADRIDRTPRDDPPFTRRRTENDEEAPAWFPCALLGVVPPSTSYARERGCGRWFLELYRAFSASSALALAACKRPFNARISDFAFFARACWRKSRSERLDISRLAPSSSCFGWMSGFLAESVSSPMPLLPTGSPDCCCKARKEACNRCTVDSRSETLASCFCCSD
mmetsp:Transcript_19925/g.41240  ORF Transcript_19925/g.41240 Transcript_19925/m.41240 type:complete len:202 (+) Transcript_19925:256-861(+)